ncbi:MAG: NUDIX domain-containing protein [Patescibacteria group bacterium]
MEYKTGTEDFIDHLGNPVKKPPEAPVVWRPSAYALISAGNRLLVVEAAACPGLWTLPGGGIEPHESLFDGLVRECREELGEEIVVDPQMPHYLAENNFYFKWTGEYTHALIMVFSARFVDRNVYERMLLAPDPEEIIRIEWLSLGDGVRETDFHPIVRPFIRSYLKR